VCVCVCVCVVSDNDTLAALIGASSEADAVLMMTVRFD
jgi:glutamate 5-kinase